MNDIDLLPCPFCGCALTKRGGMGLFWQHSQSDCFFSNKRVVSGEATAWNLRAGIGAHSDRAEPSDELVEALTVAAAQFESYEKQHLAKTPPDWEKAKTNRIMAGNCRSAIKAHREARTSLSSPADKEAVEAARRIVAASAKVSSSNPLSNEWQDHFAYLFDTVKEDAVTVARALLSSGGGGEASAQKPPHPDEREEKAT